MQLGGGKRQNQDKEQTSTYYVFNEKALNTFSPILAEKCQENPNYFIVQTLEISLKPLGEILDIYCKNKEIDFLSIDVEGLDLEVLKSNKWNKYRPKVILAEQANVTLDNLKENPIYIFLNAQGYKFYAKTCNTLIFTL